MTANKAVILIIEDKVLNLELARDLLEAKGFIVHAAETAEDGLRLAGELLPDLVLMDLSLPGMDGLCATKALKANAATSHLPIVALTANAMRGDEEAALKAGCDGYLTKPINTRTFAATVAKFIAKAALVRTASHVPKTRPNEVKGQTPASTVPAPRSGYVLVVDDEEQNRSLLQGALEARGYEVAEAKNGLEALQRIAQRPPDAVLLDVMMPNMDGFEVCRLIKKNPQTAHIPILMVTALSDRKERLMGIEAGANDFLNKPIDLQDVILRVRNAAYAKHLHDQLQAEQARSENLLLSILPQPIAERMKGGQTNIAERHADVTVLLADLVGFTTLSAHVSAEEIVRLLNDIFSSFDLLTERHGLEKIKTIGDAYMVAGGITGGRADHAAASAELALNMQREIERVNGQYSTALRLRIGICTGQVIAGVIGRGRFAYDLWGETVNLACRLESTGRPGKIQIAESTYYKLKDKFQFETKHLIDAKGHGELSAYWLGERIGNSTAGGEGRRIAA